jgi:uncharacterized membrane protein
MLLRAIRLLILTLVLGAVALPAIGAGQATKVDPERPPTGWSHP